MIGGTYESLVAVVELQGKVAYPWLSVNILTVFFGVVILGVYVAAARYRPKHARRGIPRVLRTVAVAGLLSLFSWIAPYALFLPTGWDDQGLPVVGMLAAFCLSAAAMVAVTAGRSFREKLLAAIFCFLLPAVSAVLALGMADLLTLDWHEIQRHLAPLFLIWLVSLVCVIAVLQTILLDLESQDAAPSGHQEEQSQDP